MGLKASTQGWNEFEILRGELHNERQSFEPHWKDILDHTLPRRARFYTEQVNRGERKNQKIVDTTPSKAIRTFRAGMQSGITSRVRPWFQLSIADKDMAESEAVKQWLHDTTDRMLSVFDRSNFYHSMPIVYGDLGLVGNAAMLIEEDFDKVILPWIVTGKQSEQLPN